MAHASLPPWQPLCQEVLSRLGRQIPSGSGPLALGILLRWLVVRWAWPPQGIFSPEQELSSPEQDLSLPEQELCPDWPQVQRFSREQGLELSTRLFRDEAFPGIERFNPDPDSFRAAMDPLHQTLLHKPHLPPPSSPPPSSQKRKPRPDPRGLGELYETLLGTRHEIDPEQAKSVRRSERKTLGAFYTPDYVIRFMVAQTLDPLPLQGTPTLLDPAMGCGHFLLGCAEYVWNRGSAPNKRWIVEHCLCGVDLDPLAVDLARLSLWLWVGDPQVRFSDLSWRLHVGNSLVSDPRLDAQALSWPTHFGDILQQGGFTGVIGNPPYGIPLTDPLQRYLKDLYQAGTTDTAALMILQSLRVLKKEGRLGLIVPKSLTYSSTWKTIRSALLDPLTDLVDVGKVWPEVKLEQVIVLGQGGQPFSEYQSWHRQQLTFQPLVRTPKHACRQFGFFLNGITPLELSIAERLSHIPQTLGHLTRNTRGGMFQAQVQRDLALWKVIGGKQLQRYQVVGLKGYVPERDTLPPQARIQAGSLLVQNIVAHVQNPTDHIKIIATVATEAEANSSVILDTVNQLTNLSPLSSYFLLGLLLSDLLNWYIYRFIFAKAIRTMHFDGPVSNRIPIAVVDPADPRHHRIAQATLELCQGSPSGHGRDHRIQTLNLWINELYQLTPDEIETLYLYQPSG